MEDFSKYNGEGTQLRKAQLRMLDILIEIDKICRRNSIDYWMDCGTLLGAVRHGGFVPWDDDIDICVRKSDYKRLRLCLMQNLPANMVYVDWKTDKNYFCDYVRVKDRYSNVNYASYEYQKEKGVHVDIFLVEKTVPRLKKYVDKVYGPIYRQVHNFGKYLYPNNNKKRLFNKTISVCMYPFAKLWVGVSRFAAFILGSKTYMYPYTTMVYTRREERNIFPVVEMEFEGYKFLSPNNAGAYLKDLYGDYMKIPDESKREMIFPNIELYELPQE